MATETVASNGTPFWVGANITVKNLVSTFLTGGPGHSEGGYVSWSTAMGLCSAIQPAARQTSGFTHKQTEAADLSLVSPKSPWLSTAGEMRLGLSGEQTVNFGGDQVAVYYSPLPASQWSLGVGIPVSAIDGSVVGFSQTITHGLVGVTALLLPVLIALAFLAAITTNVVSRRLLQPLSSLTGASRRIAQGDLETPVPRAPGPSDEIGTLETALEGMRQRLAGQRQVIDAAHRHLEHRVEARTSELRQRNEELAILNSVSADLSRSLVLSDVASAAAERLRQLWSVSEVSVYLSDRTAPQGVRLVGRSMDSDQSEPDGSELALALQQSDQSPGHPRPGGRPRRGSAPGNRRPRRIPGTAPGAGARTAPGRDAGGGRWSAGAGPPQRSALC